MKLLWVYMMILGLVGGLTTGVVLFGSTTTDMAPSDMRIVDEKLSYLFCDSVEISGYPQSTFTAYFLNSNPLIDPSRWETYNETYVQLVETESYVYTQFYLLAGSVVTLTGSVDSTVELNVIRGKDNFNKFVYNNGLHCVDCVYDEWFLYEDEDIHITMDFPDTDLYYFVFVGRHKNGWMTLQFSLQRTLYNVDDYISSCDQTSECIFDFDISNAGNLPILVIKAKSTDVDHYNEQLMSIETSCVARSWLYVLIFFVGPTLFSIIFSIFIFRSCSDPTEEVVIPRLQPHHERTPLLWNQSEIPAVVVLPPKYEDIVGADDGLPSYYEATANTSGVNIQRDNVNTNSSQ